MAFVCFSFCIITGCCFVTFYTRKAALKAQDALHNIKTLNGVSTKKKNTSLFVFIIFSCYLSRQSFIFSIVVVVIVSSINRKWHSFIVTNDFLVCDLYKWFFSQVNCLSLCLHTYIETHNYSYKEAF